VFLINLPIVAIALVAGWWLVPDSRDEGHAGLDLPGALISVSAISLLVYAIIEAPNHGWLDGLTLAALAGALGLAMLFFWWELRTSHPMLDLSVFRNRRFSLGAAAIGLTFFALFGTIFVFTQYLQFVQGYTPLEAGSRLLPLAFGIAIGAGRSNHLVNRFGTTRVVTMGMVIVATVLGSFALWGTDTPYWIMGTSVFLLAFGMGNVMAPATDAVMGAVPEAKAGVGSAMNDVVRQVAGALGIAIIGSILNTVYRNQMDTPATGLPVEVTDPARDSIGAALAVAGQIGGPEGMALATSARSAFVDAMGSTALVAATVALIGAAVVARWLPAHHAAVAAVDTVTATTMPEARTDASPHSGRDAAANTNGMLRS